jgi:hypothetical protein
LLGSAQFPAELIQAEDETLWSEVHKLFYSIWSKEELPDQWKETVIVPINRKGDKTECSNYPGISLLPTSYKNVSDILSRSSPYVNEIIGDRHCGFQCNRSTTDKIFCICQILEKKLEYNETVYQPFIGFKKACDSVRSVSVF